jgi:hypothetical protein
MRRTLAAAVAALMLAAAPAALAAPDPENGTVNAEQTSLKWTGTAYGTNIAGEPCNTDHSCEDFLLKVEVPGNLVVGWTAAAPAGPAWLGGTIIASDEQGTEGDVVADGGGLADDGTVGGYLDPGYYIVRLSGLLTTLATYDAEATFEPDLPAEETP